MSALARARFSKDVPASGKVHFDAAYRPPAVDANAGREWYDTFATADGRIALSIGRIEGLRAPATAMIAELRHMLRDAVADHASPAQILERANGFVKSQRRSTTAKATVGIVDPVRATFTYAAAGNPPPVLALPCMLVQPLPGGDVPLGAADVLGASDWSFTIPPGANLNLYTEGLCKRLDERARAVALRAGVRNRAGAPAHALLERAAGGTGESGEATALVVSVADVPATELHVDFSAVPLAVPIARRTLLRFAERIGLDGERRFAVITAVGEALANAVEHAYPERPGMVRLAAERTPDGLLVTIEDDGGWKPAQRADERGRGLPIMRSLMDAVEVRAEAAHTTIRLTLYTSPRA